MTATSTANLGEGWWVMASTPERARRDFVKRYHQDPEAVLEWRQWWYAGPADEQDAPLAEQRRLL